MDMLISVIVPVYNVERYLSFCIDSILEQSYRDIQLILVNDGSTDNSGEICNRYARKDKRVRVLHQENQGPIAARKNGVLNSTCEYITFVDADDFISNVSYELAIESMQKQIDIIIFGITRYLDEENQSTENSIFREGIYTRQAIEKIIYPQMIWDEKRNTFGLDPSLCNKVMKKELLISCYEEIGNREFHYGEDAAVTYSMMKWANTVEIKQISYYYHRQKKTVKIPGYIADMAYFDKLYVLYEYMLKQFGDHKNLLKQTEYFYMYSVGLRRKVYGDCQEGAYHLFPFDLVEKGSRIVIYGAGTVGHSYIKQLKQNHFCKVVLWVDKNYKEFHLDKVPQEISEDISTEISSVEQILTVSFDKVVIAIESIDVSCAVKKTLAEMGIEPDRIVSCAFNV